MKCRAEQTGYTDLSMPLPNHGSGSIAGDNLHYSFLSSCLPYFIWGAAGGLVKEADCPPLSRIDEAM